MKPRQLFIFLFQATVPPGAAFLVQWLLWPQIRPFSWFLFYPAVFISAIAGGLRAALPASVLSAMLVMHFFMERRGLQIESPAALFSVAIFVCMGVILGAAQDRFRTMRELAVRSLAAEKDARENLERRVQERTEALQKSEKKFSRAFHESQVGMAISSFEEGRFLDVNQAYADLFAYTREELIGRKSSELGLVSKEAREEIARRAKEHGAIRNAHLTMRTKTGDEREVYFSSAAVDFEGSTQMLSTVVDLTERDRAEKEVKRLNAELEQRIAERTAELAAANKELEAFCYSVSHDLRAPLRSMDGFSRALVEDYGNLLPPEGLRFMERIQQSAERMGQLIDDLLTLSRLSRARLERLPVDTGHLVRTALEDLRPEHPAAEVQIHDLPACHGDPALLKQVWINLLSNALKFSAKKENPRVEIGASIAPRAVTYFVRDNGVGFDMAYANKLFGVFQRLHRMEDFQGTGVGLAIVQRVVHRHGGSVRAESAPDLGATFYFTIPEAL
jgi:PAS domain S-box-containing protein